MSLQTEPTSAQVLDFDEYRRRRAAKGLTPSLAKRRFLWGWPATGHVTLVDFPSPAVKPASALTR